MEEFGDSYLSRPLGTEASEAETPEDPQNMTDAVIDPPELPWATGYIADVETAGAIPSGKL